jgi:hypothetical protein
MLESARFDARCRSVSAGATCDAKLEADEERLCAFVLSCNQRRTCVRDVARSASPVKPALFYDPFEPWGLTE